MLTLEKSLEMALQYSPALKLQKNKTQQVEHDYRDAFGNALPTVSASYEVQNYLKKPTISGFSMNSTYQRNAGVTVSQPLFTFGAVSSGIKAANAALEMSEITEALTEREIVYAVQVTYYTIELAQKQLEIAEESLKNATNNLNILKRSFSSGRPPQQDLIRLQADVASRSSQLKDAENTLAQAKVKFKTLLGIPLEGSLQLQPSNLDQISDISGAKLEKSSLNEQPQLKLYDKQIQYSENLTAVQKANLYPKLGAYYTYNVSDRSNRGVSDTDSSVDTSVVGLSLTWDIWSGGSNRAKVEKAMAVRKYAEIQKVQEGDALAQSLQEKVIEYNTLKETLKNDEVSVKLARESFRVSQSRFRTGKTSVTELNSVEAQLYQAMLVQVAHEFQLKESLAAIQKFIGEQNRG